MSRFSRPTTSGSSTPYRRSVSSLTLRQMLCTLACVGRVPMQARPVSRRWLRTHPVAKEVERFLRNTHASGLPGVERQLQALSITSSTASRIASADSLPRMTTSSA